MAVRSEKQLNMTKAISPASDPLRHAPRRISSLSNPTRRKRFSTIIRLTCSTDIRAYIKNFLKDMLDCVLEPEVIQLHIGRAGGKYTSLEPYAEFLHTRPTVKPHWVLGTTLLGKPIGWKPPFERQRDTEVCKFAMKWFKTT